MNHTHDADLKKRNISSRRTDRNNGIHWKISSIRLTWLQFVRIHFLWIYLFLLWYLCKEPICTWPKFRSLFRKQSKEDREFMVKRLCEIHTHENPTYNEVFDGMNAGCNQQMMKYAVKVCACVYEWLNLYSSTPSILLFKSLGVCACTVHFLFRLPMPQNGVCILSVCCVFVVITLWMRNIWQHKEHNDVLFSFVNKRMACHRIETNECK